MQKTKVVGCHMIPLPQHVCNGLAHPACCRCMCVMYNGLNCRADESTLARDVRAMVIAKT